MVYAAKIGIFYERGGFPHSFFNEKHRNRLRYLYLSVLAISKMRFGGG